MSGFVLILAVLHALPPLIGATKGKAGVVIGAIIGAGIACLTGASIYTVIDLVGVAVGMVVGWNIAD